MSEYQVQDFTDLASSSDLVASIHFNRFNGSVQVFKDGTVTLVSPKGTVAAKFRELEEQDWIRESYIQSLIQNGVSGEELEKALEAIARVDRRIASEGDSEQIRNEMEAKAQKRFREWGRKQGIDLTKLPEEQIMKLINKAVHQARKD